MWVWDVAGLCPGVLERRDLVGDLPGHQQQVEAVLPGWCSRNRPLRIRVPEANSGGPAGRKGCQGGRKRPRPVVLQNVCPPSHGPAWTGAPVLGSCGQWVPPYVGDRPAQTKVFELA